MGGTFDPIHHGHLIAAEAVRDELRLSQVLFIPAGRPPHKINRRVSPAEHRVAMVRLAVAENPYFRVSTVEINREGPSFTVDTMRQLRRELGDESKLYFITGADAVLELLTWKDPLKIFEYCQLVAVARPGCEPDDLNRMIAEVARSGGVVHRLAIPGVAISSSNIRRRVNEGRSIRYLVPDAVGEYIGRTGLYRE
jgi:nicotinate-nucleotide adenylyltransferase